MMTAPPSLSRPSPTGPHSVRRVILVGLRFIRRAPLSTSLVVLLWTVGGLTGSLGSGPSAALMQKYGTGVLQLAHLKVGTVFTAAGFTSGLPAYLIATVMLIGVALFIEPKWGSLRLFWVAAVCQVGGTVLGLEVIRLVATAGNDWALALRGDLTVGPWPLLVGVVVAFGGTLAPPWRLRIQLTMLIVVAALTLYSGYLPDALRLAGSLVGLALGFVLARRTTRRTPRAVAQEARTLIAGILVASAIGPLITVFNRRADGPLSVLHYLLVSPQLEPADLADFCADSNAYPAAAARCAELTRELRFHGVGPAVMSVLPAILVLLTAYGLRKGRRSAWGAALVLHGVLAALGLLTFLQWNPQLPGHLSFIRAHSTAGRLLPILVPLVVIVTLLASRRLFRIPAPAGTYRQLLTLLGWSALVIAAIYVIGGSLLAGQFSPAPDIGALIKDFPHRLAPPGYLGLVSLPFVPTSWPATLLFEWPGVLLWTVAGVGLVRAFRREASADPGPDVVKAREILHQHGSGALSYLTLWDGNRYWFNTSGTTYVAYRVVSGVAIGLTDPVGPPGETAAAMRDFQRFSSDRSWTACFYSTSERVSDLAAEFGWAALEVAQEAYLPLAELTFSGKKFQDIRTATSRAARAGITAHWISFPTAPADQADQIIELSREWVAGKGLPEMGFTLGGLNEIDDPEVRCLLAVDVAGRIHGITSWLPVYRDGVPVAWTLDYLRRGTGAFNGVMEFLLSSAALQFQAEGADYVSLSGAPLATIGSGEPATGVQRLLERTGKTLEPVYGFRSLLAFKAKFQPLYRPMYLVYPDAAALPRIGAAISKAYLPHLTPRGAFELLRKLRPAKLRPGKVHPAKLSPAKAAPDEAAPGEAQSREMGVTP